MTTRIRKWPVAYLVLGFLTALGMLGAFYLNTEIVRRQEKTARVNQAWSQTREIVSDSRRFARDIYESASGNLTGNGDSERHHASRALADFSGSIQAIHKAVSDKSSQSVTASLLPRITLIEASTLKMATVATEIFELLGKGNVSQADVRRTAMSAQWTMLANNFTDLGNAIETIQRANFESQFQAARLLRELQFLIGGMTFLIIGATAFYGIKYADVTHKRMKELESTATALRMSEAKLGAIFKMAPEGILAIDETGRITMFSDGAEAMFGCKSEEVIGHSINNLMPERYRSGHDKHVQTFAATLGAARKMGSGFEIVGLRKNGDEFPMEASLSKIKMPDGLIITAILRDLTRAKAMYDDLRSAKLRAEEASKAKSNFIANMSHELRTPLNAILGFSELLTSDGFAQKRQEYAQLIHGSGQHLLSLINDILDLSKVEAGGWTLREVPIDFGSLIADCVDLMAGNATARIALKTDLWKDLPPINGDERAIKQIMLNLISNAIKYTPDGGSVTVFARLEVNGEFAFGVGDTGVGIAEDEQERVFDTFGQGRHDTARTEKGTGLGLPIAKGLALAHGGRVKLESQVGVGTCVTVFLPATRVKIYKAEKVA